VRGRRTWLRAFASGALLLASGLAQARSRSGVLGVSVRVVRLSNSRATLVTEASQNRTRRGRERTRATPPPGSLRLEAGGVVNATPTH
jgi:ribosomal protein S3